MKIQPPRLARNCPDRNDECRAVLRERVFKILNAALADEAFDELPPITELLMDASASGWTYSEALAAIEFLIDEHARLVIESLEMAARGRRRLH